MLSKREIRYIIYIFFFILVIPRLISAQSTENKVLNAVKNGNPPEINGILDDPIWKKAPVATDFTQYEPYNGREPSFPTEVKIIYDNQGIYVGAKMYDPNPDSILTELGKRDFVGLKRARRMEEVNADKFSFLINPFNDGINMMEFTVSASGVKSDAKHIGRETDFNWDGVWRCAARVSDSGWVAEIMIPYSTLRFPSELKSNWGVHFFRNIKRYKEWDTWNPIDIEQQGIVNQAGEISGIRGIDPPLRLSFTPYFSTYLENHPDENRWVNDIRGGLDLKYGINESFTLDMTLIPDFGQVPTEDRVLNLTPYEQRYEEKRPFFTEGTELFTKYSSIGGGGGPGPGGSESLLYSRRIGDEPANIDEVESKMKEGEAIKENPSETKMVNATKVSGRTDNGLGIGVLNAMTSEANAVVIDTVTEATREIRTQPFTNYNMMVFDQNLRNNSFVSLINTNVHHIRGNYTGNVTGAAFQLANESNTYQISGKGAISQKYRDNNQFGHSYNINFSRTKGNFQFELGHKTQTDTYDPNDLGYNRRNNEFTQQMELEYNIFEPFSIFRSWHSNIDFQYSSLYKPRKYQEFEVSLFTDVTYKNHYSTGLMAQWQPESHDYFEPRVEGWRFKRPERFSIHTFMGTDNTKDISLRGGIDLGKASKWNQHEYGFDISPNFRFSDAFSLNYRFELRKEINDMGYVEDEKTAGGDVNVTFGKRNVQTITNRLEGSFKFSPRDLINLRIRHYWRTLEYSNFYPLQQSGDLGTPYGYDRYGSQQDLNYNALTVYLQYLWQFAPGSELSVVWKNNIYNFSKDIPDSYLRNLDQTLNAPQINSFSLKFLYYLDYQSIQRSLQQL